ncbi:MAG: FAD/NAD(P)-binding protein, partial [Gammaproteobacteria bacterium]
MEIAIVGAGFSGTLVAAHLLRQAEGPLTVRLIERAPNQFGRGVAYSTIRDCHFLNVPAAKMSAFPDDAEHFLRWAMAREQSLVDPPWLTVTTPASFLPRRVYGDYLSGVLDAAECAAPAGVRLERKTGEAVGLGLVPCGVSLRMADGERVEAQRVVLALGNFHPGDPNVADRSFYASDRYHGDPWGPEVLAALMETRSCLAIGSGLTMADWAITLSETGYRGTLHVLSRRGVWPKMHRPAAPVDFSIGADISPRAVRAWLRQIRQYIRSQGCDWRAAIDALRPTTQDLWASLALPEQRRFLRHLRPYWDCHRHRLAPAVGEHLQALAESGQLVRHVGRIMGYQESERDVAVRIKRRGLEEVTTLRVDAVVNCSGCESDYRKLESPLINDLLNQGLGHPDPLGLGLATGANGALIDAAGCASRHLYTLGPPEKGMLWETTAV